MLSNLILMGMPSTKLRDRAVLHTALRAQESDQVFVDGLDVIPEVFAVKEKISQFTSCHHFWRVIWDYTGKAITDVVNIGIGGSDLGPAMIVEGLEHSIKTTSTPILCLMLRETTFMKF